MAFVYVISSQQSLTNNLAAEIVSKVKCKIVKPLSIVTYQGKKAVFVKKSVFFAGYSQKLALNSQYNDIFPRSWQIWNENRGWQDSSQK